MGRGVEGRDGKEFWNPERPKIESCPVRSTVCRAFRLSPLKGVPPFPDQEGGLGVWCCDVGLHETELAGDSGLVPAEDRRMIDHGIESNPARGTIEKRRKYPHGARSRARSISNIKFIPNRRAS